VLNKIRFILLTFCHQHDGLFCGEYTAPSLCSVVPATFAQHNTRIRNQSRNGNKLSSVPFLAILLLYGTIPCNYASLRLFDASHPALRLPGQDESGSSTHIHWVTAQESTSGHLLLTSSFKMANSRPPIDITIIFPIYLNMFFCNHRVISSKRCKQQNLQFRRIGL
jgi:hypothetical protein